LLQKTLMRKARTHRSKDGGQKKAYRLTSLRNPEVCDAPHQDHTLTPFAKARGTRTYSVKICSVLKGVPNMGISGHSWLMPHADCRYLGQCQAGRSP